MSHAKSIRGLSPEQMRAEAKKILKTLPDLRGKKLVEAKRLANHFKYQADFKESGGLTRKQQKAAASKTTAVASQGLLPGFTNQVKPTVAELARSIVWEQLQAQIGVEVETIRKALKLA